MKAGDVINGYTILEDFKVVGAGLSQWTFAERGGRQFFIKQFLSPTYPDDAAPGKREDQGQEASPLRGLREPSPRVQTVLAPLSAYGGNLIVTLDFFRWGAKYYKVTEKVDAEAMEPRDIARLDFRLQLVLMKSVAHSLKILHDLRIVHSDLKPSNVLVKRTELGYTSKLIDFDSSYLAGNPPPPEEIVGTINYYSPELLGYIQEAGVAPHQLGVASDVFSLGLIYTEFLTGAPPPFDTATYHEPAVAVRNGETLRIPRDRVVPELADLIDQMMAADPAHRPTIAKVHATLMSIRTGTPDLRAGPTPTRPGGAQRAARQGPAGHPPGAAAGDARARSARSAGRQADLQDHGPARMTGIWRCRVCEGVNSGGRVCATCGTEVPRGEPLRAAVRTRLPSTLPPAPPPVPPTVPGASCGPCPHRRTWAGSSRRAGSRPSTASRSCPCRAAASCSAADPAGPSRRSDTPAATRELDRRRPPWAEQVLGRC